MSIITIRNLLLALLLSITVTLVVAFAYVSYPVISAILRALLSSPHDAGITAVAGGMSESFLGILLLLAPAIFLIIFVLLQEKSAKS